MKIYWWIEAAKRICFSSIWNEAILYFCFFIYFIGIYFHCFIRVTQFTVSVRKSWYYTTAKLYTFSFNFCRQTERPKKRNSFDLLFWKWNICSLWNFNEDISKTQGGLIIILQVLLLLTKSKYKRLLWSLRFTFTTTIWRQFLTCIYVFLLLQFDYQWLTKHTVLLLSQRGNQSTIVWQPYCTLLQLIECSN